MNPVPSPCRPELVEFLGVQRDLVEQRWIDSTRGNGDIQTVGQLNSEQISDHLPDLLGDLAHTLRTGGPDPTRAEARQDGKVHGRYRWQQHYRLDELLREPSIIRMNDDDNSAMS